MKNWSRIEKKVIAFYTRHIFTAGHSSSQSSESLNFFKRFWIFKKGNDLLEYISINDMVR